MGSELPFLIGDKPMSQCFKYDLIIFLTVSVDKSSIIPLPTAKLTFELLPIRGFP